MPAGSQPNRHDAVMMLLSSLIHSCNPRKQDDRDQCSRRHRFQHCRVKFVHSFTAEIHRAPTTINLCAAGMLVNLVALAHRFFDLSQGLPAADSAALAPVRLGVLADDALGGPLVGQVLARIDRWVHTAQSKTGSEARHGQAHPRCQTQY